MRELWRKIFDFSNLHVFDPAKKYRILVVRPDRLGDVLLSTPVLEALRLHFPNAKNTLMVQSAVLPLLKGLSSVDHSLIYSPKGRHAGFRGFLRLLSDLRRRKFQIAVVLQSQWRISFAIWLARIPVRIGPLSKVHSYLCFNYGVRQHRSQVEMHEADYNLQLLAKLGIRVGSCSLSTQVFVGEEVRKSALDWLISHGWSKEKKTVLIHPGMGGSALNWPETYYQELAVALLQLGHQIVVTGGPLEKELIARFRTGLGDLKNRVLFYESTSPRSHAPNAPSGTQNTGDSIDFFAALCTHVNVVVAPSTGPLHVAVALGKRVVTFYPPIRVQSALRWGPYVQDESTASILVPEVYCGQEFDCLGSLCNYFPCMKGLTVKRAVKEVQAQLSATAGGGL